ncbi:MAG: MBL fold metallo-hydrolase [Treponemataceae bacterium]
MKKRLGIIMSALLAFSAPVLNAQGTGFKVTELKPGSWRIDDMNGEKGSGSMYLLEGKAKAALIDTGMGKGDLAALVASLTKRPVEVFITHGHPDHIGLASQFPSTKIHMSAKDRYCPVTSAESQILASKFIDIKEGDLFDLGGRKLEVIAIPGHSEGSVAFYDSSGKMIAVGDAIGSGSGVWMHIPGTLPLDQYLDHLKTFEARLKRLGPLTYLVGHQWQESKALNSQYVTDMRILVEKSINGEIVAKPYTIGGDGAGVTTTFGSAQLCYSLRTIFSPGKADMTKYQAVEIQPGVIMIRDALGNNLYLVRGEKKALLIDTGMGTGDLKAYVKNLAEGLPLEVAITHGHPDHVGQAALFGSYYFPTADKATAAEFKFVPKEYKGLKEGMTFDLGNQVLKVYALPGHTPGSVVLLDEANRLLFTGDAVGTQSHMGGLWIQWPNAPSIEQYLASLKAFRVKTDGKYAKVFTGHNLKAIDARYIDYLEMAARKLIDLGPTALIPSIRPAGGKMVVFGADNNPNVASILIDPAKYGIQ